MPVKKKDYETLSAELDAILQKLESAEIGIDDALEAYKRGIAITKELESYIQAAKNKVTKIQANLSQPEV